MNANQSKHCQPSIKCFEIGKRDLTQRTRNGPLCVKVNIQLFELTKSLQKIKSLEKKER